MSHRIHKYYRTVLNKDKKKKDGYKIYKCALPNCSHYISATLIPFRETLCWGCENKMILGKKPKVKPLCEDCRDRFYDGFGFRAKKQNASAPDPRVIDEILKKVGGL